MIFLCMLHWGYIFFWYTMQKGQNMFKVSISYIYIYTQVRSKSKMIQNIKTYPIYSSFHSYKVWKFKSIEQRDSIS